MSKVISPYTVLWRNSTRYLLGPVNGALTRTSPLARLDEERKMAVTRSGSVYQLGFPADTPPPMSFEGVIEIPVMRYAFCLVQGAFQIVGWTPGGRACQGELSGADPVSGLCLATDGRIFRRLGRPAPTEALSALGRLMPSLSVREVKLFDGVPAGLGQDVLWLKQELPELLTVEQLRA
ncbi:MAG: hypothetical protein WCF85_11825 [Rhodospirillaceae bacterium]